MSKLLIASPSCAFVERNRNLLNRSDVRIFSATTGAEAFRIHQEERVDLILAELSVSEMEGDALCSLIREDSELKTVSIILTCHNTEADLRRVAQCGANAWIIKPVCPDVLVSTVRKLISIPARTSFRVPLNAKAHALQADRSFFCTILNVSVSGMLIQTRQLLHLGEPITCMFSVSAAGQIVAAGETVRSVRTSTGSHQYGIRFHDLADHFRQEIETAAIAAEARGIPGEAVS